MYERLCIFLCLLVCGVVYEGDEGCWVKVILVGDVVDEWVFEGGWRIFDDDGGVIDVGKLFEVLVLSCMVGGWCYVVEWEFGWDCEIEGKGEEVVYFFRLCILKILWKLCVVKKLVCMVL